jgi:hypothetical protein
VRFDSDAVFFLFLFFSSFRDTTKTRVLLLPLVDSSICIESSILPIWKEKVCLFPLFFVSSCLTVSLDRGKDGQMNLNARKPKVEIIANCVMFSFFL